MGDIVAEFPKESTFHVIGMMEKSFEKLYEFYQKEILCDVAINVGTKCFKCHKIVLASCSEYFKVMFSASFSESTKNVITIRDVDEVTMDTLIKCAYSAKVVINTDNAETILRAASVLQFDCLATLCCNFMAAQLHSSNCLGVLELACNFGYSDLMKHAEDFVKMNFKDILKEQEFVGLSEEILSNIISSSDLFVENEFTVYESVILWVKHDVDQRKRMLPNLLAKVRLPFLHYIEIIKYLETESLIRKNIPCRDLIDEAKHIKSGRAAHIPDKFMPSNERTRPRKSYSGIIFAVGGRGSNGEPIASAEFYSPYYNEWIRVSDMSTPGRHVGCIALKGKIYAAGGRDQNGYLNSVEVFQPLTNRWYPLADMQFPRRGLGLCALQGPIYAVGGLAGEFFFSIVERYDVKGNKWCTVQPMQCARGGVAVVSLRERMYAMGGNSEIMSLRTCEKYDPHLNKWSFISSMHTSRAGAAAVVMDGYIYVIGGFKDNEPLSTVEKYNPIKDVWTFVSPMSSCRGGVGAAVMGREIYVVGGHDKGSFLKKVEIYDVHTNSWRAGLEMNDCRGGAGVTWLKCGAENLRIIYDVATKDPESEAELTLPDNYDYHDSSDE